MKCTVCEQVKRGSKVQKLPNGMQICHTCLELGKEELDIENPYSIDPETMEEALELTKKQRSKK